MKDFHIVVELKVQARYENCSKSYSTSELFMNLSFELYIHRTNLSVYKF